ncbi:hypothetical protein T484DRAFT_1749912 [Baffinella frigidus]|nr:hypothetical protein T484DRAFT_1749912 [Cryptophyta sp. CCMP2293]
MWQENAALRAVSESELRLAAPSPTSWVFNWRADGWEIAGWDAFFRSETHAFGGGVSGRCVLVVDKTDSQYIAFEPKGIDKCRVHATFSILDKNDKILRQVSEIGSDDAPTDQEIKGVLFSVTVAEKAQSVRADGSIRVRAVVRLFLDDAA